MQTDLNKLYQRTIVPLSEEEQLRLASLIIESVASRQHRRQSDQGNVRELFGSADLGQGTGTDNDQIDADLAEEYLDSHEGDD